MKYQNGREVSPQVFQAVRYITKVGVMTRETWNEFFGKRISKTGNKNSYVILIKAKSFEAPSF